MLIIFHVFLIQVLVQYGEQRKVIIIDDTFLSTVKRIFKIDSAETLVFQEYDNEVKYQSLLRPVSGKKSCSGAGI